MSTTTISNPQKIKLKNIGTTTTGFVPYKENFTFSLDAGKTVELEASTVGQALYYLKLDNANLQATQINSFDAASSTIIVVDLPAVITLANGTSKDISFVPYKENFTDTVKTGDTLVIPATTSGQALYYLKQKASGFTVSNTAQTVPEDLPTVSASDNGNVLTVVGGKWASATPAP